MGGPKRGVKKRRGERRKKRNEKRGNEIRETTSEASTGHELLNEPTWIRTCSTSQ